MLVALKAIAIALVVSFSPGTIAWILYTLTGNM